MINSIDDGEYARDLFSLLFCGQLAHKYVGMMYAAHIDDSADRDRQRVVISSVLIGKYDDWKYLAKFWNKRLKRDGIEYFKSTHCNHLRGQFSKFCSKENYPAPAGREAANRIRADLDKIIKKSKVVGIGIVIPIPLFNKFKSDSHYSSLIPNDPYHWAVQSAWKESVTAIKKVGLKNTISFAHDDASNFHVLHDLYLAYKESNPTDARIMRDFVPLDDKNNPPIQAADAVADVTFRYAEEWAKNPTPANMIRLRTTMYKVCVWDEDYAHSALDRRIESKYNENANEVGSQSKSTEENAPHDAADIAQASESAHPSLSSSASTRRS
jgi:hypothetical protein